MKRSPAVALSVLLAWGALAAHAETRSLVIDAIEDGDTLVAAINGKQERLQLLGIDAPEDADNAKFKRDMELTGLDADALLALGTQATQHLKDLVAAGQQVEVSGDFDKRDRYGRIDVLVLVEEGKESLNERMVADGYAILLRSQPLQDDLKGRLEGLEEMAVATGRGLWGGASRPAAMAWGGRGAVAAPDAGR